MSPLHVYVHFPYCLRKCPYCDFASYATERDAVPHRAYADAVLAELAVRAGAMEGRLETVFFGGGTPSLWEPEELGRVLDALKGHAAEVAPGLEVTVECNPTSLDEDRARRLEAAGVGRLSVGVQSLDAERLAFLGRLHDAPGAIRALGAAQASGTLRVSGDLMFGVAGGKPQDASEAAREAAAVAETGVGHVSAYALTIEAGTRFGELARQNRLPLASEDDVVACFEAVERSLEERGFEHYEVSNYARPGQRARHNLAYWHGRPYLGLGAGAVGTLPNGPGRRRYRNDPLPARYLARPGAIVEEEELDPETLLRERLMLGLRLAEGLDLEAAAAELGVDPWPPARARAADRLAAAGRLERKGHRLRIPRAARLFTDGVAAALF